MIATRLSPPLVQALREIGFAPPGAAPITVTWDDLDSLPDSTGDRVVGPIPASVDPDSGARRLLEGWRAGLLPEAGVCLWFASALEDRELTRWRNALWPWLHAGAVLRATRDETSIEVLQGRHALEAGQNGELEAPAGPATLFCLRRRDHVLSPSATVTKFDANASGWNGNPGSPGYPHYRWMRRFVGLYPDDKPRRRILDFGSGAGWVGIEAALRSPGCHLAFFDPSPEMVRHAEQNSRSVGLTDFVGRTGFGEHPPFPAAGEEPYDLVLSSGVVSFSPDFESWYDGLARAVAPGGTLVVGDIHRDAKGFVKRRSSKPLLPVRELNARLPEEIRAALEPRGLRFVRGSGYQLTWPVPQAMHFSEQRLGGLLSAPILLANRIAAGIEKRRGTLSGSFDSWVLEFEHR